MDPQQKMADEMNKMLYHSGDAFLPKRVRDYLHKYWVGNYHSLFYITNWTFVHFWSGVVLAIILKFVIHLHKVSFENIYVFTFQIHVLWELWQIIIGMTPWMTLRGWVDIITDTAFYMTGVWIGVHISKKLFDLIRSIMVIVLPP